MCVYVCVCFCVFSWNASVCVCVCVCVCVHAFLVKSRGILLHKRCFPGGSDCVCGGVACRQRTNGVAGGAPVALHTKRVGGYGGSEGQH